MFRINVPRFQRTALALAGAVLVATSLRSSVAAAAPMAPAAETVSARPKLPVPVTDVSVHFDGAWGDSGDPQGGRTYAFTVTNHGPNDAQVHIEKTLYRKSCDDVAAPSCHVGMDHTAETQFIKSGGSHISIISCYYSHCGPVMKAVVEHTLDLNQGNNEVANWTDY